MSEVSHRVLWGNRFFSPCTRHVSMYLRPGIVIHSFIHSFILSVVLSHGVLFFISVLKHAVSGPQRRRAIYAESRWDTHATISHVRYRPLPSSKCISFSFLSKKREERVYLLSLLVLLYVENLIINNIFN
jgi:hypothetical protein